MKKKSSVASFFLDNTKSCVYMIKKVSYSIYRIPDKNQKAMSIFKNPQTRDFPKGASYD
jgi:hypothetical protein